MESCCDNSIFVCFRSELWFTMSHTYQCHTCNYIAVNGSDLMAHASMTHSNFFMYNPQYYSSQPMFPTNPAINAHFEASQQLPSPPQNHARNGANEDNHKPASSVANVDDLAKYDCSDCGKKFRHKGNLQRHVNTIHKKCEEFSCDLCDYKTIHKNFLNNHKKRVHQRVKRFYCDQCDYKSYDSGNLERHSKMIHMRIKSRFACELCDYKTYLAANLNRHVKAVHLRIKAYSCSYCDHKASTSQTLQIHMNNKHNVDPVTHSCRQCGKKFKASHNLRRHAKTIHKMDLD